eukprot:TRINITY_DN626_c0_g1_i11.p1 TRINITY_DN626_c0_g1~~TRINITY_DN626_c0_g1_i11.p1  ORF type:complete len:281 (-),score=30.07 TRINITY_DN626_c0_g1_i11:560-1402(-)
MDQSSYIIRQIRKRNGGFRTIAEPVPELKLKQRFVMRWLRQRGVKAGKHAHGFVRGRSIATHAAEHVGKGVVVKVDIHDFFGSTTEYMVREALYFERFASDAINAIVDICMLDGRLPQGAPTSPVLSNLVLKRLDGRMAGLAKKFHATYSRYADDLCFSGNSPDLNCVIPAIDRIIRESGYSLNRAKTRVIRRGKRQIITGCVVNRELNVPRELRRQIRAGIHNLKQEFLRTKELNTATFKHLQGMVSFFHSVKPEMALPYRRQLKHVADLHCAISCDFA